MISIFKRRTTCGYIRGAQTAKYIGAKLNPETGWSNDTCIYVKMGARGGRVQYLDFLDEVKYIPYLKKHPEIRAIAISRSAEQALKNAIQNEVVFIPQQHCNFAKRKRTRTGVTVAGWCGARGCFEAYEDDIRKGLSRVGIELTTCYDYKTRQDVIDYYQTIDIQVVWRMQAEWNKMYKNPLKISNAGSFGIPTICKPEPCAFMEYGGCFCEAATIDGLVDVAHALKTDGLFYDAMAQKAMDRAEEYHISHVAEKYKALDI